MIYSYSGIYKQGDEQTIAMIWINYTNIILRKGIQEPDIRIQYWIFHLYKTQEQGNLIYGIKS